MSPTGQSTYSPGVPWGQHSTPGDVEIPLFVRGRVWPEMSFLPKSHELALPRQYFADILIGVYFDQLHYTFPIIYKPHFMAYYGQRVRNGVRNSEPKDRRFLLVFFAVCACASSILSTASDGEFSGIDYYEKALMLYYASTGEATVERVQGAALLAMCAAGWNTLTQSWLLAGQAVRAAVDIGLHLNDDLVSCVRARSFFHLDFGFDDEVDACYELIVAYR
jgi:hypothetical protein